jgi:transposase
MQSGSKKHVDIVRLQADVAAAGVEILSAHCAADRVRLQYSPQDVVAFSERKTLKKAIASAEALCRFFALIKFELKEPEES